MTTMTDLLTAELDQLRARRGYDELSILETGSIRNENESFRDSDGWSTLTFAEYTKKYGGTVTSIDLDTSAARRVLKKYGASERVTFIDGYSVEVLANLVAAHRSFDVIMLDSDNDAQLILHEYLVAKQLATRGTLIVFDDIDTREGTDVVKGHQVVPWLEKRAITHRRPLRTSSQHATHMIFLDSE